MHCHRRYVTSLTTGYTSMPHRKSKEKIRFNHRKRNLMPILLNVVDPRKHSVINLNMIIVICLKVTIARIRVRLVRLFPTAFAVEKVNTNQKIQ
jgi:hypothetical protein